uniref:DUF4417 domain-containing protein n=1 Tax=Eubacterium cellulosolvens TaxID=29322 RepID=UPI0004809E99|nr:DUF4417 domain-containing protein [[Eubacterium] cellulosolvens]
MSKTIENLVDEGLRVSLVETAFFDGDLEIPCIQAPKNIIIPNGMVPFSIRERSLKHNDFVCFYEHDIKFRDILTHTEDYVDDLKRFPGIITPDCSLYVDAPLIVQLTNIYLNRAIGHYLQSQGLYVIPNIRWGDERTFTTEMFRSKVAFLGVEKHSIVSIGTYGQIKTAESKQLFRNGLIEMLDELEPEVVLVYGSMPDKIFHGLLNRTRFISYPDWTTRKKNPGMKYLHNLSNK